MTGLQDAAFVADQEQHQERAERPVLHRAFAAELTSGEGRTVDVRIVPYGETALADDGYGGLPVGVIYREEWMPGAFSHQLNAANRVLVNFEHEKGFGGVIGHGIALRDAPDGFHGSFKLHETPEGEKALMLVREGVLGGVSVEALPVKQARSRDGVVQRIKANLRGIALCRQGAYPSARVLALREPIEITDEIVLDEKFLPIQPNPETIERCRRLGIALPQRYQEAHPAETDTPAETGTPEAGTRPKEAH